MADGAPISQMLVPQVRGALADPGAVEGRPSRVLLRVDADQSGDAPVVRADVAAVAEALRGGAEAVSVPGIGTLTCTRPTPERALEGQVAVVTGGAGGLGFSVAQALAAEGAALALFDIADGPVGEAADAVGGIGVACDVTDAAAVDAAMAQVVARYGGVDILISNAGSAHQGAL
ncbi:MAG: SDR family NAD(P)-dependent oxidoreductase, partial [Pseudomonadota bacterium]